MRDFVLKIRRYDGSESVIDDFNTIEEAQAEADRLNGDYQSKLFHVEAWDRDRAQREWDVILGLVNTYREERRRARA